MMVRRAPDRHGPSARAPRNGYPKRRNPRNVRWPRLQAGAPMSRLTDYVTFQDKRLAARYENRPIPMATLYEAYFDGDLDFAGDIYAFLRHRNDLVKYSLTWKHLSWAITHFLPEVAIHSKRQDRRIVREHYDRGNDFFGWFLGERM